MKKLIATTTLVATAAAGTAILVASPASADVEKHGTCAGAQFELNVDNEGRGFEVSGDVDNARAFSEWTVAIRHNGKIVAKRGMTADDEGDLDLETYTRNARGKDTFKLTVTPAGGSSCSVKVSVR